jgi:cytochrome c-type biogenesis protein CcmH
MTAFIAAASAAVVLALALLLRPFFRLRASTQASQRDLNTVILREQLAKLDQDLAEGTLRREDYTQARAELQRRVLEDTSEEDAAASLRAPKRTLIGVALVVPLVAAGVYLLVGNPDAVGVDVTSQAKAQQDVEKMVQTLADKLAADPGNLKGWAMLARSYKVMGRSADAEKAFERAGSFIDNDAQMLADYVDVAVSNANGSFAGKPEKLLEKALKADPDNAMALWLAGTAAMNNKDYERAIALWERLSGFLQPGSEDAENLRGSITEARALAGRSLAKAGGPIVPVGGSSARNDVAGSGKATAAANASVSGVVELAPALKAKAAPTDTVMVIARAPGMRMPLAVLRVRASELPLKFTLDDSLSMSPQARLSSATEVNVEARISKSGQAMPEPGDLISAVRTVKVGARDVNLQVAQVRQ